MNKTWIFMLLLLLNSSCKGQRQEIMEENKPYILWDYEQYDVMKEGDGLSEKTEKYSLRLRENEIIRAFPKGLKELVAMYSTLIPSYFEIPDADFASVLGNFKTLKQAQDSLAKYTGWGYYPFDDIIRELKCGRKGNTYAFWWSGGYGVYTIDSAGAIMGCNYTSRVQTDKFSNEEMLQKLVSTDSPGIPSEKASLSEKWIDTVNTENYIRWNGSGVFSFSESNQHKTYCAFGEGTYLYQPATQELFALTGSLNEKQAVSDIQIYSNPYKKYFHILEKSDSTITVQRVIDGYSFDWEMKADGLYHLTFLMEVDYLPFEVKTYKRMNREGFPNDLDGLIESLNSWGRKEAGKQTLEAFEYPELYPNCIIPGKIYGILPRIKQKINDLGFEAVWNKEKRMYELVRK